MRFSKRSCRTNFRVYLSIWKFKFDYPQKIYFRVRNECNIIVIAYYYDDIILPPQRCAETELCGLAVCCIFFGQRFYIHKVTPAKTSSARLYYREIYARLFRLPCYTRVDTARYLTTIRNFYNLSAAAVSVGPPRNLRHGTNVIPDYIMYV